MQGRQSVVSLEHETAPREGCPHREATMTRFHGHHRCGTVTVTCLVAQLGEILHRCDKPAEHPPRWFVGGVLGVRPEDVHRLGG